VETFAMWFAVSHIYPPMMAIVVIPIEMMLTVMNKTLAEHWAHRIWKWSDCEWSASLRNFTEETTADSQVIFCVPASCKGKQNQIIRLDTINEMWEWWVPLSWGQGSGSIVLPLSFWDVQKISRDSGNHNRLCFFHDDQNLVSVSEYDSLKWKRSRAVRSLFARRTLSTEEPNVNPIPWNPLFSVHGDIYPRVPISKVMSNDHASRFRMDPKKFLKDNCMRSWSSGH
jgi:hypothetical protein